MSRPTATMAIPRPRVAAIRSKTPLNGVPNGERTAAQAAWIIARQIAGLPV